MKVKIKQDGNEKTIELKYSMRIYLFYEGITGHSVDYTQMDSYTNIIQLFYSTILATLQANHENIDYKFQDFLDMIDECHGERVIQTFSHWFVEQVEANGNVIDMEEENKDELDEKPKKKSKKG